MGGGGGKHDSLSWSPDIAKINTTCHMNYSIIFTEISFYPATLINLQNLYVFQEVVGVILGGVLGHALCTGLAVLGGRYIASKISIRTGNIQTFISFPGLYYLHISITVSM